MNITIISQPSSTLKRLSVLQPQYDVVFIDSVDEVSTSDLTIYDSDQTNNITSLQTSPDWMVINETETYQSLKHIRYGASGILGPDYCFDTLRDCIRTIQEGGIYLQAELVQILAMRQIRIMLAPFSHLSSREYDVFCLLAEACPIHEIAQNLSISAKTAFNCQSQIKRKLGLKNQLQMNLLAKKNGLI